MIWRERNQMPAISKIRLANVIYEDGNKRYNDELFLFDGYNGAILLENGGGKTVLIQTAIQAMIPHTELAGRKMGKTLALESTPAHIAVEWIINEKPRRYVVTAVTLFTNKHGVESLRYVYEYQHGDPHAIEEIPFVREVQGGKRPADRGEMQDYYSMMKDKSLSANTFTTIKSYRQYIEDNYQIIGTEWESIVKINSSEGGVEAFFEACKTTNQLFDRLLIPTVEDAIVGHDKKLFATLFEQRYASFKNYQKLKETIEENKKIQGELAAYTTAFERLHEKEQQLLEAKQRTKGIWEYTEKQKQAYVAEKAALAKKEENWQQDKHQHQVKLASYSIAEKAREKDQADKEYEKTNLLLQEQKAKTTNIEGQHAALRYAKFAKEQRAAQDSLTYIQEQIASFEEQADVEELKNQLHEVEQALHGAYQSQIEEIEKQQQGLEQERNPLIDQIQQLEKQLIDYQDKQKKMNDEIIKFHSFIESREKDSEKLRQSLLSNPEQEKVEEQLPKWEERYQDLDDELIHLKAERKRLAREVQEKQQEKGQLQEAQQQNALHLQRVKHQLDTAHKEEEQLIYTLAMLRSAWQDIDGIHLQQQTIHGQLENNLEKQRIERKKWLDRERVALRYVDDYGGQETFFSDPFLSEQMELWKNQFDYIETGVDYLAQLPEEKQKELKQEALWSSIIVTTAKSKSSLVERLEQVSDRIMFPVLVVTTEEAIAITAMNKGDWIVPIHWRQNLKADQFAEWKQHLTDQAKEITKTRENTESEIKKWEQALKQFRDFLSRYPYEQIAEWQEHLSSMQTEAEKLEVSINQVDKLLNEMNSMIEEYTKRAEEAAGERSGLENKLRDGRQYIIYQNEIKKYEQDAGKYQSQMQDAEQKVKQIERSIKRYQEDADEKTERIRNLEIERQKIIGNPYYQEVSALPVRYTDESITILLTKREDLQLQKESITRQIGEWEAKKEAEHQRILTAGERMEEIEQVYPLVDKSQTFPADGDQYIEQLQKQLQAAKAELKNTMEKYQSAEQAKEVKKALLSQAKEDFKGKFPDDSIKLFTEKLTRVKQQLQTEENELLKLKDYLNQEMQRVGKELLRLENAERLLEKFIEGYHFNAPGIASISLSEQAAIDFQYHCVRFAEEMTEELKEKKQVVEEEKEHVTAARDRFRAFCRNHITDRKLQQMAIQGVEQKRAYEDVITFKQNMFTSIQRITKYANEHIRKSDEELQLFINQIHTHLQTLVEELEQIPKKTRVKADDWKQIYSFSIPKWEPEDGKLRIRHHMEWIIKQLEDDKYRNDEGHQDTAKIRTDLERWLNSKQLLKVVMDRDVLKVHCRKVTNDNQISTRSFSWEQSNVWSGGEKWSKNMTLFLGILKYVAEKKKANLTNRSVILDNPFGEASSDHVLSPVFFIAEQLGFQMIALTAHAEGKFLQDYFPIIYSCRLRASKEASKKVMTTEKWLHHAYFQDHEPAVIDRLGQTEQLDLFGK